MKTLLKFRKNYYSQHGEDGVIEEIFKRLQISDGWFVEFGAADGKDLSNSYMLVKKGWKGVEIEGDLNRFESLKKNITDYKENIIAICEYVSIDGINSLDSILLRTPIPKDFDLLSIDVDSCDWQIWNSLNIYRPKIVIIEINNYIPPRIEQIHSDMHNNQGSSFSSTLQLGIKKGYKLVCHTGNLIFVRADLICELNLSEEELNNPESLFLDDWISQKGVPKVILYIHFYLKATVKIYRNLYEAIKKKIQ